MWLTTNYHRDTHKVIHFFLIVFLNHPFCDVRFFQLFQNKYPFIDYYKFLFTLWVFLYHQDPEDEILVLLNHFDFFMNVNYVYNVMNIICFNFVPYQEVPPHLENCTWLATIPNRNSHNIFHFYLTPFV